MQMQILVFVIGLSVVVAFPPRFDSFQPALIDRDDFIRQPTEYSKRRPQQLRNCFLSPVQCLLPVNNQRFNRFHKRFF